jgi:selenocysteine lyase/cysteine desulfurase
VFELWESSVADRLGLIAAVRYASTLGFDAIASAVRDRAARLRAGLSAVRGVTVRDIGAEQCGIVTFTVEDRPAGQVRDALARHGVTVTVSGVESTRYDMTRRNLAEVVRASPHYFVSPAQVDQAVAALAR